MYVVTSVYVVIWLKYVMRVWELFVISARLSKVFSMNILLKSIILSIAHRWRKMPLTISLVQSWLLFHYHVLRCS